MPEQAICAQPHCAIPPLSAAQNQQEQISRRDDQRIRLLSVMAMVADSRGHRG
jgi:hypothetical protein